MGHRTATGVRRIRWCGDGGVVVVAALAGLPPHTQDACFAG